MSEHRPISEVELDAFETCVANIGFVAGSDTSRCVAEIRRLRAALREIDEKTTDPLVMRRVRDVLGD